MYVPITRTHHTHPAKNSQTFGRVPGRMLREKRAGGCGGLPETLFSGLVPGEIPPHPPCLSGFPGVVSFHRCYSRRRRRRPRSGRVSVTVLYETRGHHRNAVFLCINVRVCWDSYTDVYRYYGPCTECLEILDSGEVL